MIPVLSLAAETEGISMMAQPPIESLAWFTNSVVVTIIVTVALLFFARRSTAKMELIPTRRQNLFEALIEALYDFFEGIVGKHMIFQCFSFLATVLIFLLATNIFGLLPGIGTIGFGEKSGPFLSLSSVQHPLLRPSGADLNMTAAMALVFMVLWLYWTLREIGAGGFIMHLFAPKGGMKGVILIVFIPLFLFVGVIECVSIVFRPITLSLRHFGNLSAGEILLHIMGSFGINMPFFIKELMAVALQLPFYFYELLVALIQAFVFTLLCASYIQLSTSHDSEEGHTHR